MCSSQQPLTGADSVHPDQLSLADLTLERERQNEVEIPYRCLIEDYDGMRYSLVVRAIGPRGAEVTARQTAIDRGYDIATVLKVEEDFS